MTARSRAGRCTGCRSASRTSSTPPTCRRPTARRSTRATARPATPTASTWLREQGAVILGKTVTTEFATYEPPPTVNPHDPERTPGGSSSGSAAAVADGMVPLAYGTQTAGSVIRPASFCGVVGFKPSARLGLDRRHQAPERAASTRSGRSAARSPTPRCWPASRRRAGRAADRVLPHAVVGRGRSGRGARAGRRPPRPRRARAAARVRRPRRRAGDRDGLRRRPQPRAGVASDHRERLSDAMREYIERASAVRRKEAEDGAALGRRLPRAAAGGAGRARRAARPGRAGRGPAALRGPHRRPAASAARGRCSACPRSACPG